MLGINGKKVFTGDKHIEAVSASRFIILNVLNLAVF